MKVKDKQNKPRIKMKSGATLDITYPQKESHPIVISEVKRRKQQGTEVFIVVKRNDAKEAQAEVEIFAPTEGVVVSVEGVRRDVKNIMAAIEVVNKRIETDERDRQRLLSMCTD